MSIVDVIQAKYPSFRVPAGNGWVSTHCPFHGPDSNPSASINVDLDFFQCRACSVRGNSQDLGRLLQVPVNTPERPVERMEPSEKVWEPALTESQRQELWDVCKRYSSWLSGSPAEAYLESRELRHTSTFGLGFVREPGPGHDRYVGRLSIPYLRATPAGSCVVGVRFRCVEDHVCKEHGHPKYLGLPGAKGRLYNTAALFAPGYRVGITEGELDAVAAQTRLGLPSLGVPGAQAWRESWRLLLKDFDRVYVFEDGDNAGREFGDRVTQGLGNAVRVRCPDGEDVESYTRRGGKFDIEIGGTDVGQ